MASLNKAVLLGNVGKDPEIRYAPSGDPIAGFSLATSESWKDKSGAKQERTEWHSVSVFGKLAEIVRDYVTKGSQIYIEGQIVTDEWVDKDGAKQRRTKVKLSGPHARLVLLGSRPGAKSRAEAQQPDERPIDDSDVPF